MKDLILGGKGFIGQRLVGLLTQKGNEVKSFDRSSGQDLENAADYEDLFRWADRVWFLAWHVGIWKMAASDEYQITSIKKSLKAAEATFVILEKTKKPFLFASSQLAGQLTPYGAGKAVGEVWAKHLGGIVSRFWNPYGWEGVGDKSHVITDLVHKALTENKIECMTDGEELRQFLYVDDCVKAIVHQFEAGQPYADITSWEWVPLKEAVRLIATECGVPMSLGLKKGGASFANPMVRLEGWNPSISLEKGIGLTVRSAKEDLKI